MGKSLYLEASSGIAGDMFVAALLDLGADRKALDRAVSSIPAKGFTVEIGRVQKAGIDCCDFNVILDRDHENHDHDMAYLYGPLPEVREEVHEEHHCHCHEEEHDHGEGHHCHCHEDDHEHHEEEHHCHCHEDDHGEEHHCHCHEEEHHHEEGHHHHHGEGHHHEHRHLKDVEAVIDGTDMTESARALAKKIFRIVAEAESKAHNLPIEEVHFHEVGAIDSIVDIISAAVCFDSLGITSVIVPKLSEGTGTVRCQHGVLPVPVPATLNIVTAYHMPLEIMDAKGEYVTPTGAAIAAALATSHSLPASFTILKTGLGAGKRDYKERTNILRAILIDDGGGDWEKDEVVKLESDIDDTSGEVLGYTMKKLMDAGALDVHFSPIYMKKNRPAFELTVICKEEKKKEMEEIIFRETTTIGIREFSSLMRSILHREEKEVDTSFGPVKVKEVTLGNEKRRYPEYESVKKLAEEKHVPFQTIFDEVKRQ
ncbi:nickel pincer cofactor biosynthesis protein LarC [uncultured Dialister sp.]|uniref:nickel pincer cofactor biosynthesis protein LarC n=1 Tax=uncultured Dialister sp. TaxID=278064 RepID=UPI0026DAA416|nr:nickel pincer cofactor biosynthesis protein LarC [uncultured Dialister sp.]